MEEQKRTITTDSGFICSIDDTALDDMEIFEDLIAMESGEKGSADQILASKRVMTALIGEEQEKALRDHLREAEGRVKISSYTKEFVSMFNKLKEPKKK